MSTIYDLLFADQDLEEVLLGVHLQEDSPLYAARARLWEGDYAGASALGAGVAPPWSSFLEVVSRTRRQLPASRTLRALAEDPAAATRPRLWAWRALRVAGDQPTPLERAEVLGLVVEVPIGPGTDVLAAYSDGSVRYLNHAGRLTAHEAPLGAPPRPELSALLAAAMPLLKVPPAPRDAEPVAADRVRFTALSAAGLHRVDAAPDEIEEGGPHHELFVAAVKLLGQVAP